MCGIVGKVYASDRQVTPAEIDCLLAPITHRGPDDVGNEVFGRAGLGQRRLAIIDLSPAGHNPMTTADGRYTITFNGESYNFQENRRDLEAKGYTFRSQTDTEVLLNLYAEYGSAMVEKISGMYAFAIWDRQDEVLFVARDRVGKKPFYYTVVGDQFIFSSEIKSLLADPAVKVQVDDQAVYEFLHLHYVPAPRTGFVGIHKLPAAHTLTWRRGNITMERYWHYSYEPKLTLSLAEAKTEGLRLMRESVRQRMIADVPLGAHLSGGLDSSLVVALMAEQSTQPVKTFSIGFDDPATNELPYAEAVAQALGTDHHSFVVKPEITELLPELARMYDEPYADAAALPYYYLSRETRKHVTVALNGDGGDENFSGYRRYLSFMALRHPALALRLAGRCSGVFQAVLPAKHRQRLALLGEARKQSSAVAVYRLVKQQQFPSIVDHTLAPEFLQRIDAAALDHLWQQWWDMQTAETETDRATGVDVVSYLADGLTKKVDIASMAHALEVRAPLLDHQLLEWSARLPVAYKLGNGQTKIIEKEIAKELLPAQIFERKKQPFIVPLDRWFSEDLSGLLRATLSHQALLYRYVQRQAVERLVAQHLAGQRNAGAVLYAYVMLELWLQQHS